MRDGVDCPAIDAYRQAFVNDVTGGTTDPIVGDETEDLEQAGEVPAAPSSEIRPAPNNQCPQGSTISFGDSSIYAITVAGPNLTATNGVASSAAPERSCPWAGTGPTTSSSTRSPSGRRRWAPSAVEPRPELTTLSDARRPFGHPRSPGADETAPSVLRDGPRTAETRPRMCAHHVLDASAGRVA